MTYDNKSAIQAYLRDLETARTTAFFDLRVNLIKQERGPLPANLAELELATARRNIEVLADQISKSQDSGDITRKQRQIEELKTKYSL